MGSPPGGRASRCSAGSRTYTWHEHTAELELRIEAAALEDVFGEALAALGELLAGGDRVEATRHEVTVSASDLPTLLVEWLNELVYLADAEGFVPERTAALALDGPSLRATVEGHSGEPRQLVKAVTYHGLELTRQGDVWQARVVLDV